MRKILFEKFYISNIVIALLFFLYQNMLNMTASEDRVELYYVLSLYYLFTLLVLYIFSHFIGVFNLKSKLFKKIVYLLLGVLFVNLIITNNDTFKQNIFFTISAITPYLTFIFFNLVFKKYNILKYYLLLAFFSTIFLVVVYFREQNIVNALITEDYVSLNIAYFPLLLLPTLLCFKNKYIRAAFIIVISIVIFSSMKRGGLIAFFISLFFYYAIEYVYIKQGTVKNIIYFVSLLVITSVAFLFYDSYNEGYFLERVEMISEDEGSGRLNVYDEVIDNLYNSTYLEFFLGHGEKSVEKYTSTGLSAHNDFLEVVFDYGILILLIYILLHIELLKFSRKLIIEKSFLAAPFAMSYILFLSLSFVSHVIIYPYFVLLTSFWGMSIGIYERANELKEMDNE